MNPTQPRVRITPAHGGPVRGCVVNHSSVFPPVSPGRAREVDAAGLVCWRAQMKTAPEGAGNTNEDLSHPMYPERTYPW